ncbi:MAG: hypothetical protein S4CHLAM2_13550 [Chlamydiales bacterium]|nr:hypothetical protein [Chlamydiales bacterium]
MTKPIGETRSGDISSPLSATRVRKGVYLFDAQPAATSSITHTTALFALYAPMLAHHIAAMHAGIPTAFKGLD